MTTPIEYEPDDQSEAVRQAGVGAVAWRAVVVAQRGAAPDHGDFYALAGELVDTLRAFEQLVGVLGVQVQTYGLHRVLRDDEGCDPAARLASAAHHVGRTRELLGLAERAANNFWSAIGHVAVEES